jgi:glycosyltransferase involved in cell wall biosynthesis
MPKVFVSDAILQDRLIISSPRPSQDRQRRVLWGWKALSALYQASLAACGYRIAPIVRPEIYQTDIARRILDVEPDDWHLAVKPIEHLRPFHGIPNVFVCDWPFPELSAEPLGDSPFFDQARLLQMADAVLCCTDFTRDTLRAAGIERAVTLPPHIPPRRREDTGSSSPPSHQGAGCRFLSVVDVDHLSRQLGPTIEGFAEAAQHRDGLSLVICVQGAGAETLAGLRQRVEQAVTTTKPDETISVFGSADVDGSSGLYTSVDFFLCTAAVTGLCLPLIDAMFAGVPLVTTLNPGIASFLPQEIAVPIATELGTLDRDDEPIARFLPLTSNAPTAAAVRDAVLAAAALDDAARSRMAVIGRETAERRFGLEAFKADLSALSAFVSRKKP